MQFSSHADLQLPDGKALARAFAARVVQAVPLLSAPLNPLLSAYFDPGGGGASGLNHDGSALQLCLVLRDGGTGWRAVLDPGLGLGTAGQRFAFARQALAQDLAARGAQAALPLFAQLLDNCGPDAACSAEAFGQGVFWLGAELGGLGRAVYVDASARPAVDGWARAATAFHALADADGDITATLDALASIATPSSIGLEVRGNRRRLKIHCRFFAAPPERVLALALPMLVHPPLLLALAALMQDGQSLSLHGFVVEAAFDAATGRLSDAKLDLALTELCPADQALDRARRAATALRLGWPEALTAPLSACSRLSYVGVGRDAGGAVRLNLYFKPWTPE